jgi:hypothetical protein
MRDIQYPSHATHIYTRAADGMVSCGIGHFRFETAYVDGSATEQELKVKLIPVSTRGVMGSISH